MFQEKEIDFVTRRKPFWSNNVYVNMKKWWKMLDYNMILMEEDLTGSK